MLHFNLKFSIIYAIYCILFMINLNLYKISHRNTYGRMISAPTPHRRGEPFNIIMRIENEMTSKSVMNEFAERIKQYRINMRITQAELSKRTGISIRNIVRIEKGEDTQFNNIIKILSVLHLQNNLDLVIPDNSLRPTNIVDLKNKKNRSRASKIKNDKEKKFAWGDSKIN